MRCLLAAAFLAASTAGQVFELPFSMPTSGHFVAAGDFDGDGDPDPVWWSHVNAYGAIVLSNQGPGAFLPGPLLPIPELDPIVRAADVTGDGRADLLKHVSTTATTSGGIEVRPSLGGGVLGAPVFTAVAGSPGIFVTGRIDGDALDDVAVMSVQNWSTPGATLHRTWLRAIGGGVFVVHATSSNPGYLSASSVVVLDADGDGISELASLEGGNLPTIPQSVAVHTTVGSAITTLSFPLPPGIVVYPSLQPADVDGDGDPDLLLYHQPGAAAAASVLWFRNDGGGSWPLQSFETLAGASFWPEWYVAGIEFGDGDGDGSGELVVMSRSSSNPAGKRIQRFGRDPIGGTWTHRVTTVLDWTEDPWKTAQADFDGDGTDDLVAGQQIFFGGPGFNLATGAAPIGFDQIAEDFDGDGDLDFRNGTTLWRSDGAGGFQSAALIFPPAPAGHGFGTVRAFADFDGDGVHEVIADDTTPTGPFGFPVTVAYRRLSADGSGQLTDRGYAAAPGPLFLANSPRLQVLDLDGDGDLDLAPPGQAALNDGTGFFTPGAPSYPGWKPVASADLDGDADADLVAVPHPTGVSARIAVLRNQGGGVFVLAIVADFGIDRYLGASPRLRDADDDGDPDLVVCLRRAFASEVAIVENAGGGVLVPVAAPLPGGLPNYSDQIADAADLDLDGRTDLVTAAPDSLIRVHRKTGPGWTYAPATAWLGAMPAAVVDMDADGDPDFLGGVVARNRHVHGPAAGRRLQYGAGTPGSGLFQPLLGATGPLRAGVQGQIRIRQGLGGAPAVLVAGLTSANLPNTPLPGLVSHVWPWAASWVVGLGGTPSVPGGGALDLPVHFDPFFTGLDIYFQTGVIDPLAPSQVAVSRGLHLRVGP